jgi:3-oxoacyl-[acyl-carrier-protein] synthase III
MAYLETRNVKLSGLAVCVPKTVEENRKLSIFHGDEADKFIASTGIERRRIANRNITASDLCLCAAEGLIKDLNWNKAEINCLVFVTQTPDYLLPSTACILQDRLGLSEECYSLDLSSGCSGWVYGTSVITSLMQNGSISKGLLLVGDTILKINSPKDKSSWPIFGDAGTASAFEYNEENSFFQFHFATDGSSHRAIIVPEGGFRIPFNEKSLLEYEDSEGIIRNRLQIILDGMNVFSFGIFKAPESVSNLISHFQINKDEIDAFIFHQANLLLNEKIRIKLKLPRDKVPYSLLNYGNTSSATIPLTLLTKWRDKLLLKKQKILATGFGVGLSWGSVYFETSKLICSDLLEL